MKDAEIVDLYWDRNEAAIQQTQQKYGAYLSKIAYNILSDFEDSRECVNDTYLNAWNSMPTHRPSVLSTYLGKIARQISIDLFRKKNSAKRHASEYAISLDELGDSFSDGSTPEQAYDAKLLDEAINRFLRTLPDDARNTFIGRYYFFDSLKDVAGYCGMSEAKAKSVLYRTRQSLKAHLIKLYRVYGIGSADDIASITEMGNSNNREIGNPVTDRKEIAEFYDMTVALWSYGNDDFQKQMFGGYPDEETQIRAHTAFADDRRNLRIETVDGLCFFISFHPSFDWICGGGTMSYFKIDEQMHAWIDRNLN